jgi:hypothetical protein
MASIFKELKPLMNATFEASQSINRTAPILACTQVLMIVLLTAIFCALFGLLITLNPDLEAERQQVVTPAVRFLVRQAVTLGSSAWKIVGIPAGIVLTGFGTPQGPSRANEGSDAISGKGPAGGEKRSKNKS